MALSKQLPFRNMLCVIPFCFNKTGNVYVDKANLDLNVLPCPPNVFAYEKLFCNISVSIFRLGLNIV